MTADMDPAPERDRTAFLRKAAYSVGTVLLGALLVVWTAVELVRDEHTALSWITLVIGAVGVVIGARRLLQLAAERRG